MFFLYDNTEITSTDFIDGWCQGGIEVLVNVTLMKDSGDWILPKGMKLKNWSGKIVGEILNDYVFYLGYEGRSESEQTVLITGYIQQSSIRTNSIIENLLIETLGQKDTVKISDLKKHIDEFRYEYDGQFQGLKTYLYYENIIDTYAPVDRIRLIFQNNILICIIHTRKLEISNTINVFQPKYHFLFYKLIDEVTKEKFIADYNKFFKTIEI